MSAHRFKRGHHDRARLINRAIEQLAALGPEGACWSLLASTDPAAFLRAVADHIQELRDELRGATSSTARGVPGPNSPDPQPETHP